MVCFADTEAQRSDADIINHRRERSADLAYVASAKLKADKTWRERHSPANGKLLMTKVKVALDSTGKMIDCKILTPSGSEQEDKSVQECLNTLTFAPLRPGLTLLDLFWTLMSDGNLNMVECTDSPEANSYYTCLIGCKIPPSGDLRYQSTNTGAVILLNNSGVIALKANNYPLAIEKFEAALKLDPKYQMALDNRAIARNNYGLQLRANPKEALKQFHQAAYLNPNNPTSVANMNGIIKFMGKDPRSFDDRVKLGDEAKLSGDFIGAIVEYSQALKINEDPAVRTKLAEATKILADCRASGKDDEGNRKPSVPIVDMGPYMADLQRRIKRAWFPPEGHQSDRVVVAFKIHKLGTISDLKLTHSSGVAASDQAALVAIQHASPVRSLPADAPDNVDIQFTFDYNAFNGGGRATIRSF